MRRVLRIQLALHFSKLLSDAHRHMRWLSSSQNRSCSCSETSTSTLISTTSSPPIPRADHRALGTSLGLFTTHSSSPGSPLFLPAGTHVFHKLQAFLRAQYATFGIHEVITPTIYKKSLWQTSGHWENYKDDMFDLRGRGAAKAGESKEIDEDEEFSLKPMNCPGHCLLFKSQKRSYRDLPIRYADFSPLHRNEVSGSLSGLTRVRRFHQDDGHIFCRPSQVREEIERTLEFVGMVYGTFELGPYKLVLSTRPKESYIGKAEEWDRAEAQLKEALDRSGREWEIHEGDGAFYGPKIDIILRDSDGKELQTATIQLDFQLPQRFALEYQAPAPELEANGMSTTESAVLEQSGMVTPVIIHRAILGSLERFMALLIEHYKGHWPFWLSPRQAIVLTVDDSEEVLSTARSVVEKLSAPYGLKKPRALQSPTFVVDADYSHRSVAKKVSEAKRMKYNFIIVLGKRNTADGTVDVDITGQARLEKMMSLLQEIGFDNSTGQLKTADGATGKAFKNPRAVKMPVAEVERLMVNLSASYL